MRILASQLIFVFCFCASLKAQTGTLINTEEAQESYTLYYDTDDTYLIDNCGGIINYWFGLQNYHLHPKFLPNGNILFNQPIVNGEKHDLVEVDWDGNEVNRIQEFRNDFFFYYENIRMENGNTLCVARENLTITDFENIGFDIDDSTMSPEVIDMIVEVDPQGNIVWEWHLKDHIIQERDPNAENYGIVADHPELLDLEVLKKSDDWRFFETFMINSFDYNPTLDQIAISVRKMSEIIIIDHSTSTQEAAGSNGGNSGKGGDILWRWGNPQNYGAGTIEDRYLYYQHNPNWIEHGVHKGKLTCYNNGLRRPNVNFDDRYSTIPIIDTKVNSDGTYNLVNGEYSPDGLVQEYSPDATETQFYSSYTSGAEVLNNGNIHITIGQDGAMMEINPQGETVWKFDIEPSPYIYRSEKYSVNNPLFNGKDLTVKGQIPTDYDCKLYTTTLDLGNDNEVEYIINSDFITLKSQTNFNYFITNNSGMKMSEGIFTEHSMDIDISNFTKGIYYLSLFQNKLSPHTIKFIKF